VKEWKKRKFPHHSGTIYSTLTPTQTASIITQYTWYKHKYTNKQGKQTNKQHTFITVFTLHFWTR